MLKDTDKLWIGGNPGGKFAGQDKNASKWNRVAKIQKLYPEIDRKLRRFCEVDGMTERKACAFATLMMIETGIRVGNEDSADGYVSKAPKTKGQVLQTYGLTTLQNRHISFEMSTDPVPVPIKMTLNFIGKKSIEHDITVTDSLLVKVGNQFWNRVQTGDRSEVRWLSLDDGTEIMDKDVTAFIKKSIHPKMTPKDFRAFRANVEAARLSGRKLSKPALSDKKKDTNAEVKKIVEKVSHILGNTPGIARKAYINPEILRRHWEHRGFTVELQTVKGKVKEIITKAGV